MAAFMMQQANLVPRVRSLSLTKRIAASGNEIGNKHESKREQDPMTLGLFKRAIQRREELPPTFLNV